MKWNTARLAAASQAVVRKSDRCPLVRLWALVRAYCDELRCWGFSWQLNALVGLYLMVGLLAAQVPAVAGGGDAKQARDGADG